MSEVALDGISKKGNFFHFSIFFQEEKFSSFLEKISIPALGGAFSLASSRFSYDFNCLIGNNIFVRENSFKHESDMPTS